MESRRLSGRRPRPLRRLSYAAQFARRGTESGGLRRRRRRQLARLCPQRPFARAGAVGRRRAVCLSAPRLASRSRHGARPDGASRQQFVFDAGQRRPRHRGLYGRHDRRADAGPKASERGRSRAGQIAFAGVGGQFGRRVDLRGGLRILPRDPPALTLWRHRSRAEHGDREPRSAQPRQHRAVGRSRGRGRTQPDHAGLRRQHERRADCGFAELSARALQQAAGLDRRRTNRRGCAPHETVFLQTSAGPRNAPAEPTQRGKP